MASCPLPPARPLWGPLRPVSSARTTLEELPDGRFEATIAHAPLSGVSPAMIAWFLANMSREMTFRGETAQAYLWWHPLDHVRLDVVRRASDGSVGPGCRLRIQELFGRDERYRVDEVVQVPRLDEGGITLERYKVGQRVFQLSHSFTPTPEGALYRSRLVVGSEVWWLKGLANRLRRRRFPEAKQRRWLQHNVEEVGYLECFLPELYAAERKT
jgi:hypothetical protein